MSSGCSRQGKTRGKEAMEERWGWKNPREVKDRVWESKESKKMNLENRL